MKKYTADDIKPLKQDSSKWDNVDISRGGFMKNLNQAVCVTRDFTRGYVINHLPDSMKYLVCLGCSYDGNPLTETEVTFPAADENTEKLCETQNDVVELLWRDGVVPEWVNVQVHDADENYTYLRLECCGRFSAEKSDMYHPHEGRAPFHILGPDMPIDYQDSDNKVKFDLHWRKNA